MAINFEIPDFIVQQTQMVKWVAESTMRPYARQLDEDEHVRPKEFAETIWPILRDQQKAALDKLKQSPEEGNGWFVPAIGARNTLGSTPTIVAVASTVAEPVVSVSHQTSANCTSWVPNSDSA